MNGSRNRDVNKAWVCVLVDYSFFSAAPYLINPVEDLPLLYKFRNHGPTETGNSDLRHWHGRKQENNRNKFSKGNVPKEVENSSVNPRDNTTIANSKGLVLLRLRPGLERSERRTVHQILASSRRREFETSTVPNVPLDYADKTSNQTTAISVQWSFNALRTAQKKRKRVEKVGEEESQSKRKSEITATFCVLQKRQIEHQAAVKRITETLRCRPGDIGKYVQYKILGVIYCM